MAKLDNIIINATTVDVIAPYKTISKSDTFNDWRRKTNGLNELIKSVAEGVSDETIIIQTENGLQGGGTFTLNDNVGKVINIALEDGGITPNKLSAGAPSWNTAGTHFFPSHGNNSGLGLELNWGLVGSGPSFIDFHSTDATNKDFDARIIKWDDDNNNSNFVFENTGTGNITFYQNGAERMRIGNDGRLLNRAAITIDNGNADGAGLFLNSTGHSTFYIDNYYGNFRVIQDVTERMKIDGLGRLVLGGSGTYGAGLYDGNSFKWAGDHGIRISRDTTVSANQVTFHNPNGHVGFINTEDDSTVYASISDYRLKEDIVEMEGSLDRLKALKPCNFAWKSNGKRVDGFIAHEAQEVVPEAVTGTKDAVDEEGNPNYQGIDQAKLVPLLTKALQEAVAKIESLEARVAALES